MGIEESSGTGSQERTIPGWAASVRTSTRLKAVARNGTRRGHGRTRQKRRASAAALKSGTIKIGYVTPSTGSLADFAGPDKFVLSLGSKRESVRQGDHDRQDKYKIEVTVKNSQSDPSIASTVTTS